MLDSGERKKEKGEEEKIETTEETTSRQLGVDYSELSFNPDYHYY